MVAISSLAQQRRVFAVALVVVGLGLSVWHFSPGLPVLWEPSASAADVAGGKELFEHEWEANDSLAHGDGLGPVFNARSCVACHFQGGVGGGGSNKHNVVSFEVQPTLEEPQLRQGLVHASAVSSSLQESEAKLRTVFPISKGFTRTVRAEGCSYTETVPDFDPVTIQATNSTALFGAGWIDRISTKAITSNQTSRMISGSLKELTADFSAIPIGRPRTLSDGRIGKFGWKAQFATLKEFVAAACANELGLSNPLMNQATPLGCSESPKGPTDLDKKQLRQLVAFVDTLPRPVEIVPDSATEREKVARGKQAFDNIGCAVCHLPDMGGVKGVYSDFLLHTLQNPNEGGGYARKTPTPIVPLPSDHPKPEEWKTPPLWGVADSAPYFHDGGSATLLDAILRHDADAKTVTEAFRSLPKEDQEALIAFLETLKAPPAPGLMAMQASGGR